MRPYAVCHAAHTICLAQGPVKVRFAEFVGDIAALARQTQNPDLLVELLVLLHLHSLVCPPLLLSCALLSPSLPLAVCVWV